MKKQHLFIILSCCIFSAASIGIITNCMGLFIPHIADELHIGIGTTMLYVTLYNLSSAFFAMVLAKLLQHYSFRLILTSGVVISALSLASFAFYHQIFFFYLSAILLGIGTCCYSLIPITLLLGNWFILKHGFISGICLSFSGLSGALFNPIINTMITSIGWRATFVCAAGFILLITLPCALYVHKTPEEINQTPYGSELVIKRVSISQDHTIHKQSTILLCIIFAFLISFITGLNANLAAYANSIALSSFHSALLLSFAMCGNVISKIIIGILCDRWNAKAACLFTLSLVIIGLGGLLFIASDRPMLSYVSAFLFGFIFAVNAAGIPLLLKEIFGMQQYTKMYSMISVFTSLAYAISVSVIGFFYDLFDTYHIMIFILIVMCFISSIILYHLKRNTHSSQFMVK